MNVVHSHKNAREDGRAARRATRDRTRDARRATRDRTRDARRASLRSRREVKPAEERRRDILDAALRLFAERGFNETTVGDIATAAGMATGTVYLYFPSKEDVLEGLHERFRDQNAEVVAAVAVDAMERAGRGEAIDYRETVDAILDAVAGLFVANRDLVAVCTKYRPEDLYESSGPAHGGHMNPSAWALQEGVRLGLIHTSDPEMTAYLFDAALAFNLHTHVTFGDPPDLDRLMAAAKEMIHKTLALPPEQPSHAPAQGKGSGSPRRRSGR